MMWKGRGSLHHRQLTGESNPQGILEEFTSRYTQDTKPLLEYPDMDVVEFPVTD